MIQETESLCRSEQCKAIVACFVKQHTAVNSTACSTVKNWVLKHLRAERLDFCTVNSFGLVVIIRPKGRVEVVKSYGHLDGTGPVLRICCEIVVHGLSGNVNKPLVKLVSWFSMQSLGQESQ